MSTLLTLTVNGKTIRMTAERCGMYDLEKAWRLTGGVLADHPKNWDEDIATHYLSKGELKFNRNAPQQRFLASSKGLYAYLGWLCPEFFLAKISALIKLQEGDLEAASEKTSRVARKS